MKNKKLEELNLKVLTEWSVELEPGEMQAIIIILDKFPFDKNESLITNVNLDALNGIWDAPWSMALMHSLRANKLLFISAPSILRYLLLL